MGLIVRTISIIIVFVFFLFGCKEKKEIERADVFIDELGNEIYLKSKPSKIISAAPNITEIIYAIDAQSSLVGRTSFCNYPKDVESIPVIGDLINLNFEKIVEVKPDLIFMTVEGNTKETFDKLKTLDVQVYVINPRDINGILNSIKNIAAVLEKKDTADALISSLKNRLKFIRSYNLKKQSAMFVVSLVPLIIAGQNTFINDLMLAVNLENISPQSVSSYPILSREEVLQENPDWIILPASYSINEILENYPEWKSLSAIKNRKVIFVEPDLFFRPGPRFIEAVEFLFKELTKKVIKR